MQNVIQRRLRRLDDPYCRSIIVPLSVAAPVVWLAVTRFTPRQHCRYSPARLGRGYSEHDALTFQIVCVSTTFARTTGLRCPPTSFHGRHHSTTSIVAIVARDPRSLSPPELASGPPSHTVWRTCPRRRDGLRGKSSGCRCGDDGQRFKQYGRTEVVLAQHCYPVNRNGTPAFVCGYG